MKDANHITIKNASEKHLYFLASLILESEGLNYTFSECYLAYKEYRSQSTVAVLNKEVKILTLVFDNNDIREFPEGDSLGHNKYISSFENNICKVNRISMELWKFNENQIFTSNSMPEKVIVSDSTTLMIEMKLKKTHHAVVFQKPENELNFNFHGNNALNSNQLNEFLAQFCK
ncbi:MAG TPA: hypothetical protein VGF30_12160 [Bacteroidia bacterium]